MHSTGSFCEKIERCRRQRNRQSWANPTSTPGDLFTVPRRCAFALIHALSLFVLKTEMVTNARINLKLPSFVNKYYACTSILNSTNRGANPVAQVTYSHVCGANGKLLAARSSPHGCLSGSGSVWHGKSKSVFRARIFLKT